MDWSTIIPCWLLGSSLWGNLLVILHCSTLIPFWPIRCTAPKGADPCALHHLDSFALVTSHWAEPMGSTSKRFKGKKRKNMQSISSATVSLLHLHISDGCCVPLQLQFLSKTPCFPSSSSHWVPVCSPCPFYLRGGNCFPLLVTSRCLSILLGSLHPCPHLRK